MPSKRNSNSLKPQAAEAIRTLDIVFPNQTNHYNTMFGGEVIAHADKAAYFAANRFCRTNLVTASMERFDFMNPLRAGDTVECIARVVYTGRTSMVVKVDIWGENAHTGNRVLCTTGYLTMVALDEHGKPTQVPPLKLRTKKEQEEWEEARKIRKTHQR